MSAGVPRFLTLQTLIVLTGLVLEVLSTGSSVFLVSPLWKSETDAKIFRGGLVPGT